MKDWKDFCLLSLVHFMAYPEVQNGDGPFVRTIESLAKLKFFDALELGQISGSELRREVRSAAKYNGFKLASGAQPVILKNKINLNSLDPYVKLDGIEKIKKFIDESAEIGAESVVILSGKDPGDLDRDLAYAVLKDSLVVLGAYANALGIRLVLEIFDRSIEKCALVGPASEAHELVKEVRLGLQNFGLLYDMGHMPLANETPEEALPLLINDLAEVHLGNCVKTPGLPGYGDQHPRFNYPGGVAGVTELKHFLEVLFDVGYLKPGIPPEKLPWLGFEVRPQEGETSDQILQNIQWTWQEAWDQLDDSLFVN